MKRKLFSITVIFSVLLLLITLILIFSEHKSSPQDAGGEAILAINEITQLAQAGDLEKMEEKVAELQNTIRVSKVASDNNRNYFIMCGICIFFLFVVFSYVYLVILRPFDKMYSFAQKIAQGDFDVPLNYERSNYFGAFTWAFDSMRREITKARSCEREAIENNKTVIATLSHDIKTPIASIRAYAEGLEANMDGSPEKRRRYLDVIMKKCDEVSALANDLFLHSLADLDKLKMFPERLKLGAFMENALGELSAEQNDISFLPPGFEVTIFADKNRLTQITENLINNARKYAQTHIEVSITQANDNAELHFRDYGEGIADEDMPFIFHKFYRGKNCGNRQGSGLGLYIVKYITEQMNGKVLIRNHTDGLEVIVSLPIS